MYQFICRVFIYLFIIEKYLSDVFFYVLVIYIYSMFYSFICDKYLSRIIYVCVLVINICLAHEYFTKKLCSL